ncbi:unnamed protein product [Caenorhabditis nigoni]
MERTVTGKIEIVIEKNRVGFVSRTSLTNQCGSIKFYFAKKEPASVIVQQFGSSSRLEKQLKTDDPETVLT